MDSNFKKPFLVPELQDVPLPHMQAKTESLPPILNSLCLSNKLEKLMTLHIEQVGLDHRHFDYSVKAQCTKPYIISHRAHSENNLITLVIRRCSRINCTSQALYSTSWRRRM